MKKYDCSKTLDFAHELKRICNSYPTCGCGCPLKEHSCTTMSGITQECIDVLQKWSDEHPEAPKLTKKDRVFLECFKRSVDRKISKDNCGDVFYVYDHVSSFLSPDMFEFLERGTTMTFEELLKLDVEEEE